MMTRIFFLMYLYVYVNKHYRYHQVQVTEQRQAKNTT